jgi:hypothetical protein
MLMHCFVDTNHAGNTETRRSQTGVPLLCNAAPIIWFSKRQNSVEASTFGSEFTAMKNHAVEMTEAMRCKLHMFGVPTADGRSNAFCNTTRPKSALSKKHHSVACHRCREAVAAVAIRVSKEHAPTNLANPFAKTMPAPKREDSPDNFTR